MERVRFDNLVDEATAGLQDDPELRLDVRTELLAHLEDTVREQIGKGMGEEDSVMHAAGAFGSPLDMAGALLAANKGRMKLRALLRLGIRAVLVPAAVVIVLLLAWTTLAATRDTLFHLSRFGVWYHQQEDSVRTERLFTRISRMPAITALPFSFSRDLQQRDPLVIPVPDSARERPEIWLSRLYTKDETNPVYLARSCASLPLVTRRPWDDRLRPLLPAARRIDPDNALYDYLLCSSRLAEVASGYRTYYPEIVLRSDELHAGNKIYRFTDRVMLKQAMQAFRAGMSKPYCSGYRREFRQDHLSPYLPANRFSEQLFIRRLWMPSGELDEYRFIAIVLPLQGFLLMRDGRREEADFYLSAWRPFARQVLDGDRDWQSICIAREIALEAGEGAAAVYEQHGLPEEARKVRNEVEAFVAPMKETPGPMPVLLLSLAGSDIFRYPGASAKLQLNNLLPLWRLEHTLVEEATLAFVLLFMLLAMIFTVARAFGWRLYLRKRYRETLLLLPRGTDLLRIACLGVVLPLLAYALLSRMTPLDGRDMSIVNTGERLLLGLGLLAIALAIIPAALMQRVVRRRCRQLGVPLPGNSPRERTMPVFEASVTLILFVMMLVSTAMIVEVSTATEWFVLTAWLMKLPVYISICIVFFCTAATLYAVLRWVAIARASHRYALYYSTLMRSLVPIHAAAILLICGIAYPMLALEETSLIKQYRLVFQKETTIDTTFADRVVADMRAEMLQALGD
jgi:hypothetical protein